MKNIVFFLSCFCLISLTGCSQQSSQANSKTGSGKIVGGGCEGCEAIYTSPVAFEKLSWIDTLPDFNEAGPKLIVSGIIYKRDGRTPAKDVVLYVYHTDQTGHYTNKYNEPGYAGRNGYIKGWMKTNEKGEYKFYTLMPGHYPGTNVPAHIHPIIKEPGMNEYYIDEYLFDDDPVLTSAERKKQEQRGGSGIISLDKKDDVLYGERNIILGLHIPDYPSADNSTQSGLDIGENCPAFDPMHISGADKGTHTCPMCKYGYAQGIMLWTSDMNIPELKSWAKKLDNAMKIEGEKKLRVFIVYTNPQKDNTEKIDTDLQEWATELDLQKVAVIYVPSVADVKSNAAVYHINPKVSATLFIYRKRKVIDKYINPELNDTNLRAILQKIEINSM